MLIRWANEKERQKYGYSRDCYGAYDVLLAQNRMNGIVYATLGFARAEKNVESIKCHAADIPPETAGKMRKCAMHQIHPKGHSFHYDYPAYAAASSKEHCLTCQSGPMPEGFIDLAELSHSYAVAEPQPQGRLYGKCHITAKYHAAEFEDMPYDEMCGFMQNLQTVGRALHRVSGAVKINYEMHANSVPHLHCHLFPRYLDDDFPSAPIDYRLTEPNVYESQAEYHHFITEMQREIQAQMNKSD